MPVHNMSRYLPASIGSMLGQTFGDFEFIIIDDGSTDDSVEVIRGFKDSRIRLLSDGRKMGQYKARNLGLARASGKYICIMDADDVSCARRLELQSGYLDSQKNIGLVGGLADEIDSLGNRLAPMQRPLSYSWIRCFLLKENCIIHSSVMLRNELVQKYRLQYNEQMTCAADYALWVRCAALFPVRNLQETIVLYRRHETQLSVQRKGLQQTYADRIRLRQLARFGIQAQDKQNALHLRLLNGSLSSEEDIDLALEWADRLLRQNALLKLYPPDHLDRFLKSLIHPC